jgi:hypothetical protein
MAVFIPITSRLPYRHLGDLTHLLTGTFPCQCVALRRPGHLFFFLLYLHHLLEALLCSWLAVMCPLNLAPFCCFQIEQQFQHLQVHIDLLRECEFGFRRSRAGPGIYIFTSLTGQPTAVKCCLLITTLTAVPHLHCGRGGC